MPKFNLTSHPFCSIFVVMLKKRFIITFFFFTYAIVFAHGVIPHHHHDQSTEHSTAHSDNQCSGENEDENGLSHGFEHYLHAGTTSDIYLKDSSVYPDLDLISSFFFHSTFTFRFASCEAALKNVLPDNDSPPLFLNSRYAFGLRAPPFSLA